MDGLQRRNLGQIDALNQRGGRTLSVVDLVEAGTVSCELMGYCWGVVSRGASFLTAALRGGVGKSTLLANLLAFLPAGEEIVTFGEDRPDPEGARACHLAHEIGSGHYYGYIWGGQVQAFLGLAGERDRVASCLHADTMEQVQEALLRPPLNVAPETAHGVHMVAFIQAFSGGPRRVTEVWEATGAGHALVWRWDQASDGFEQVTPSGLLQRLGVSEDEVRRRVDFLRTVGDSGARRFEEVREAILAAEGGLLPRA